MSIHYWRAVKKYYNYNDIFSNVELSLQVEWVLPAYSVVWWIWFANYKKDLGIWLADFIFGLLFIGQFGCSKYFMCTFNKVQYQDIRDIEISDFYVESFKESFTLFQTQFCVIICKHLKLGT